MQDRNMTYIVKCAYYTSHFYNKAILQANSVRWSVGFCIVDNTHLLKLSQVLSLQIILIKHEKYVHKLRSYYQ